MLNIHVTRITYGFLTLKGITPENPDVYSVKRVWWYLVKPKLE